MSSSNKIKELTVLCPNGRRVNIKTSPSTSIGQIIEEACLKHEFDPYSYNMKFLHRTLDPSSTLQYSNIPNRAQVELIKASVRREEGSVTVNLVTEKGQRLIADFPSSTSLWDILLYHENQQESNFCIPAASSGFQPFIVYTMQRIIGEDLKTTTLKSLGLYSGKCMMRYNVQKIEDIESSPIVIVSPKTIMKTIQASKASGAQESQNEVKCVEKNVEVDLPQKATTEPVDSTVEEMECDSLSEKEPTVPLPAETSDPQRMETRVDSSVMENIENQDDVMKEAQPLRNSNSESNEHPIDQRLEEDKPAPKIIPLSDHNSVLFSLDDAPSAAHIQESEDFFELTLSEVRRLYRDKVKELREMEEAPLMTTDMRQLEKDSRMLSAINRHPVTHLRICFPDRHVIQANFKPHNTIKDVKEFLSPLLIRSDLNFDLYTLFPRTVLDPSLSLVDAGCIPNARLYFSADGDEVSSFLSKETLSKKSSFEAAANAVRTTSRQSSNLGQDLEDTSTSSFEAPRPTPSPNTVEQSSGAVSRIRSTENQNVPKWFKLGK